MAPLQSLFLSLLWYEHLTDLAVTLVRNSYQLEINPPT